MLNIRFISRNEALVLALTGLYIYELSKGEYTDFEFSRAWAMGVYSALTILYSFQPWLFYDQLLIQIIGTTSLLADTREVYAYITYPAYIALFTLFWYTTKTQSKVDW